MFICQEAIEQGIIEHEGMPIKDRLITNEGIIKVIRDEIKRRLEAK